MNCCPGGGIYEIYYNRKNVTFPSGTVISTSFPRGRKFNGIVPDPRTVLCSSNSGLTPSWKQRQHISYGKHICKHPKNWMCSLFLTWRTVIVLSSSTLNSEHICLPMWKTSGIPQDWLEFGLHGSLNRFS